MAGLKQLSDTRCKEQIKSLAGLVLSTVADKKRREELILKYTPLVKNIVERISMRLPSHIDKKDLFNVGVIGLMSALEKFDEGRNVRFETYARFRIQGAILDELRTRDEVPRSSRNKNAKIERAFSALLKKFGRPPEDEEVAEYLGISLEEYYKLLESARGISILSKDDLPPDYCEKYGTYDVLEKIDQNDPFALLARNEIKKILKDAIESLPEKEKLVLSLYYYEELTLKEIGKIMELTEARICQIHSKSVMKLRVVLKEHKESGL